ncbi:MAG: hypothetical protein ACI8UX_002372 [Psychromonas sp.]|jgi:hypothetical protein
MVSFHAYGHEPRRKIRSIYFGGGGSDYMDGGQRQSLLELISIIPDL